MPARFTNYVISCAKGQAYSIGPDGFVLNGTPCIYKVNEYIYIQNVVVMSHEQARLILSPDGDGVEAREQLRNDLEPDKDA